MHILLLLILTCTSFILSAIDYNDRSRYSYQRLGLNWDETKDKKIVDRRCRQLMFQYHPDKFSSESEKKRAQEIFVKINNDCDELKQRERPLFEEDPNKTQENKRREEPPHTEEKKQKKYNFREEEWWKREEEQRRKQEEEGEQRRRQEEEYRREEEEFWRDFHERQRTFSSEDTSSNSSSSSHHDTPHLRDDFLLETYGNYPALYALEMRRAYARFCSRGDHFYGTVSTLGFLFGSPILTHINAAGALTELMLGYKNLWIEYVVAFSQQKGSAHMSDLQHINVHLFEMPSSLLFGGAWGNPAHLFATTYGLVGFPGMVKSHGNAAADRLSATSWHLGLGTDGSVSFPYGDDCAHTLFTSLRWLCAFPRKVMNNDKELAPAPINRGDFLFGYAHTTSAVLYEGGYILTLYSPLKTAVARQDFSPRSTVYLLLELLIFRFSFSYGVSIALEGKELKGANYWGGITVSF